jgi:hypothetical protein
MGFKPTASIQSSSAPPSLPQFGKDDKWKLASQLQKAIRQGKVDEAGQAALDLNGVDAAYLRYRLSVISVEDMAAGSPEVVISAFGGGWKKAQIEARGGVDFLVQTAREFAASVKDRTPCDMMYCTKFVEDFNAMHGPWENLSWDTACRLALDPKQPWWARALGAWRCAGTDKFQARTAFLPDLAGDWDRWVEVNRDAYGDRAAQLMRIGENQREHHHVFIGVSMGVQDSSLLCPALPDLPNVGPWLSAALDKHTSEGRRALTYMVASNPSGVATMQSHGVSRDDLPDLLGRMWFWLEGSRCDQELSHELSRAIRIDNQERTLKGVDQSILLDAFGDPSIWQAGRMSVMKVRPPYRPSL